MKFSLLNYNKYEIVYFKDNSEILPKIFYYC